MPAALPIVEEIGFVYRLILIVSYRFYFRCMAFDFVYHFTAVNLFGHHVGLVSIIALLTSPICILKQLISVIQLVTACRNLGHFDGIQHAQVTNKTL